MPSLRRSLALSFAAKYSNLVIATVSVMVLARLLTPAEIGVYSVGAAAMALAHVLREFGIGNYLIQEKELTRDRIRTAFTVALVFGWGMAFVLFAISGPVSRFYDEPGIARILRVLSLSFLVIPFSSPVLALLRREMAFGTLYLIAIASALAHALTAISLAVLGFGSISLAWASFAGVAMTAAVAAFVRPSVATVLPAIKEWRRVVSFGSYSSAAALVAQIGINANDLILGRMLGFAAVGLYSRAQGLISLFHRDLMGAVHSVALPAFATEHREGQALREPYLRGISYVTMFAWPFFGFLALMAYPTVRILFGPQWDDAVPLVRILSIAGAVFSCWSLGGNVLIATGHVKRALRAEVIIQTTRIALIVFAAHFGLEAVAGAQVLTYSLGMLVYYRELTRISGITLRDGLISASRSFSVTVCSLFVPAGVWLVVDFTPERLWLPFSLALVGFVAGWFLGLFMSDHPAKQEVISYASRIRIRLSGLVS